jgi:two-component system chemotaxis response regulator CheB
MLESKLRVLVVDDSAFIRKAVVRLLGADPGLEVVAQASSGEEALQLLATAHPQVVTLDLVMPGIGGLATLEAMKAKGLPVVVLSGAVSEGAVALQALEMGAFDVVAKPAGGPASLAMVGADLIAKLRGAAHTRSPWRHLKPPEAPRVPTAHLPPPPPPKAKTGPLAPGPRPWVGPPPELILLGVSTGGPPALQRIIPQLPEGLRAPVVVLQHMPPGYTKALAERLDRLSAVRVREAEAGDRPQPGEVLVAPSGKHLSFVPGPQGPCVALLDEVQEATFYRPCIDHAFLAAARLWARRCLGVVLTGMGADGSLGVQGIRKAGGKAWAQDEASSAIYGMPRAAAEVGVDEVVPLDQLAFRLQQVLGHPAPAPTSGMPPSRL